MNISVYAVIIRIKGIFLFSTLGHCSVAFPFSITFLSLSLSLVFSSSFSLPDACFFLYFFLGRGKGFFFVNAGGQSGLEHGYTVTWMKRFDYVLLDAVIGFHPLTISCDTCFFYAQRRCKGNEALLLLDRLRAKRRKILRLKISKQFRLPKNFFKLFVGNLLYATRSKVPKYKGLG